MAGNGPPETQRGRRPRHITFNVGYLLLALVLLWLFQDFVLGPLFTSATSIPYREFRQKLSAGQIVSAQVGDSSIDGEMKGPTPNASPSAVPYTTTFSTGADPGLVPALERAGITFAFAAPPSPLGSLLLAWVLPLAVFAGLYYLSARQLSKAGGVGGIFGVGKSKAQLVTPETVHVTFQDVGGAAEAIAELQEITQFLKTPEQFARPGGRIPKGVLLVGPPGTGKTLLAKATAGEAGVAFLETSGSEFVELFVGVGASRVRDLFDLARTAAPAIIFIDEIDAIGQSRSDGRRVMGVNDEREQTLNQLLAEVDGFDSDSGAPVIMMAATNRPEVLDPALLRAGRFDRQIEVGNPDYHGRIEILRIHSRGLKLASGFDIAQAARMTAGFSGADLANVINEAALHAARRSAEAIALPDFEAALERIVAGLEQRNRVMSPAVRERVAYHESGHALVSALVPHADPVSKISIVPHSRGALGYTIQLPDEDSYLLTQAELEDRIAAMLGGRAAEQLVFGVASTGASDDFEKATALARRMVAEFGMSETLGWVHYLGQQAVYLGNEVQADGWVSPETAELIDAEVRRIIGAQAERALSLLKQHRGALERLSRQLLERETVDGDADRDALAAALPALAPGVS